MTASHAALASTNVPLAQSLKAKSTLSTLTYALTAALALTFAPLALSLRANNSVGSCPHSLTQPNCCGFCSRSCGSSSFLNIDFAVFF